MNPDDLAWSQSYTARNEGGFSAKAYPDSRGIPTVGIGCKGVDPFCSPTPTITLETIWTPEQGQQEFARRHEVAVEGAENDLGPAYWVNLDGARQAALCDGAYQMGETGLGEFHEMLGFVRVGNWQGAHDAWLDSLEAHQTPERAQRNATILLTGLRPALTF
jgi:lysozyme